VLRHRQEYTQRRSALERGNILTIEEASLIVLSYARCDIFNDKLYLANSLGLATALALHSRISCASTFALPRPPGRFACCSAPLPLHYFSHQHLHSRVWNPCDYLSVTTTTPIHGETLMAEAIVVIGIVASIVQLVDFSSRVLHRLEEFQTGLGEIPVSLRHIKVELPVLQDTLQQTRAAIDAGSVRDATKNALLPAIEGCTEQIRLLDSILAKMLPTPTDSRLKRGTKAILSLHQEPKIESITKILRCYVGTLTFYYAAISSTLQPLTGNTLPRECIKSLVTSSFRCKAH